MAKKRNKKAEESEILYLRKNENFVISGKIINIENKENYFVVSFEIISVLSDDDMFFEIDTLSGVYLNKNNDIKDFNVGETVIIKGKFNRRIKRITNTETNKKEIWNMVSTDIEKIEKEDLFDKNIEIRIKEKKNEKININFDFNIKEEDIINDNEEENENDNKKEKVYKKIVKVFS